MHGHFAAQYASILLPHLVNFQKGLSLWRCHAQVVVENFTLISTPLLLRNHRQMRGPRPSRMFASPPDQTVDLPKKRITQSFTQCSNKLDLWAEWSELSQVDEGVSQGGFTSESLRDPVGLIRDFTCRFSWIQYSSADPGLRSDGPRCKGASNIDRFLAYKAPEAQNSSE